MYRWQISNIEEALIYFREQRERAYEKYQKTGLRKHADDEYFDSLMVSAIELAMDKSDALQEASEKRSHDIDAFIQTDLTKDNYSREEVEEILRKIAWW